MAVLILRGLEMNTSHVSFYLPVSCLSQNVCVLCERQCIGDIESIRDRGRRRFDLFDLSN